VLTAGRLRSPQWPRFLTVGLHRNIALLAGGFLALHIAAIVADTYTSIPLTAAFVPFASPYQRFRLALGTVALDLLIVLVATSLARARLGYRGWRLVHWCGYACWPVAVAHGAGAGTDARTLWGAGLTLGCVAVVAGAVAWRLLPRWPERRVLRLSMAAAAAVSIPVVLSLGGFP
jgi:methionine sulfoxide reductase heme-binding subunit